MIKNLWNKTEIVCGCHEGMPIDEKIIMQPKAGHKSMFYACPKYYPENRQKGEIACVNHVNVEDFQKILNRISEECEKSMIFGQSPVIIGFTFKLKDITVKVLEYTPEKLVIQVYNKKAIA